MKRAWKRETAFAVLAALLAVLCMGCGLGGGYATVSMEEAQELIPSGEYLIVDVRTAEEYQKAHIPGAILLPIEDIREGKADSLADRDQAIMVYCWTGRRAEDAAALLANLGYTHIYNIGGLIDWTGEVESDLEGSAETDGEAALSGAEEASGGAEADTWESVEAEA